MKKAGAILLAIALCVTMVSFAGCGEEMKPSDVTTTTESSGEATTTQEESAATDETTTVGENDLTTTGAAEDVTTTAKDTTTTAKKTTTTAKATTTKTTTASKPTTTTKATTVTTKATTTTTTVKPTTATTTTVTTTAATTTTTTVVTTVNTPAGTKRIPSVDGNLDESQAMSGLFSVAVSETIPCEIFGLPILYGLSTEFIAFHTGLADMIMMPTMEIHAVPNEYVADFNDKWKATDENNGDHLSAWTKQCYAVETVLTTDTHTVFCIYAKMDRYIDLEESGDGSQTKKLLDARKEIVNTLQWNG